ncbi:cytochrome c biogenesis CcdA family protein [Gloeobacter violaceus]|uniref:Gll3620 protein n=1 Tax=Gloeobacter violaceus (strain ATCC 29082 / PCC 7421) TaxID=251221 RepID=Q7NFA6_GLOVI|nr:cytochrome c biogenesis CcdA family protein [Gloeobacter violaceus]BAC91561.1 gll3620 [Gloeobacter violaceus PCC 7421]
MVAVPLGLAFAGGFLTVLSPCILPVLPILVGRSLRSHRFGPVALVIGLVGGFALAGSLLGVTAEWFAGLASFLRTAAIALLLALGLAALFPERSERLWARLGGFQPLEPKQDGLWGELLVGSQLGLIWTPCAGPVLGSILTLAAVGGQPTGAFGLLLVYGLGAAVPMLVFAYGGRYLSARLLGLRAQGELLQRIAGAAVAASALAILLGWDVTVQLWLAPLLPTPTL